MSAGVTPNPADEFVTFVQHQIPGLEDGTYELTIDQRIDDAHEVRINDDTLSVTYRFGVTGDRFSLANPAATISSVFPAPNATGEYTTSLANVVFSSPTFPWARAPTAPTTRVEVEVEKDVPTWMAVLVLDADDEAAFEGLTLEPKTRVVGDLFPRAAWEGTDLEDGYSYFEGAKNTDALEIDETVDDPVQTIDIPLALFADIAPTLSDLALTAHIRRLSVHNKALMLGTAPPVDPIGTYSIVVGNRLPSNDIRSRAYLVSLEGLEAVLPATSAGGTLTDPSISIERSLRLAVLSSWVFNTKGGSEAFVDRLERLNGRSPKGGDAPNTNLRVEIHGAVVPIGEALAAGYVPLDHELRTDETTVSWYRGPLSPVDKPSPVLPTLPIASPDAALTFDPTTGMLDTALAAAWTIGRLIALGDKTYSTALYGWKRGLSQKVLDAIERELIDELMGGPAFDARPERKALLHATMRLLAQGTTNGGRLVTLFSRERRGNAIAETFGDPRAIGNALGDVAVPDDIAAWLGRLRTLHGVPFGYLVPDEAMLPPESIRFFRLDDAWVRALLDGAFSLGRDLTAQATGASANLDRAVFGTVAERARVAAPLRVSPWAPAPRIQADAAWTGFVLRSSVVADYPGLGVNVYGADETPDDVDPEPLPVRRLDRLGPGSDTVFCLVEGDARRVDVHEAPEVLHHGINTPPGSPRGATKKVHTFERAADGTITLTGEIDEIEIDHCLRERSPRVIKFGDLAAQIADANDLPSIDSAQLGFEMTQGVGMVTFIDRGHP